MTKRVVINGGGRNLFKVEQYSGYYYVYYMSIGFLFDDKDFIGKTRSFEDAISLIRSYSGKGIKEIY